nr:retrovirus-related Pol polyprotein from transposon TNT 1-94 [Tanacetum cinerariifolium]
MQTQTSNTLHNAIMEAGSKDRPPMLAPGNYVQWKSRIKRYIDTKPNHELIHYCLKNPPYKLDWQDIEVPVSEGSPITTTARIRETYKNGESINVQDLESNLYWEFRKFTSQDVLASATTIMAKHEVNEIRAERIARVANPLALVAQQQPVYHPQNHPTNYTQNSSTRSQQAATQNRGKAIVNSPQPIYDQEPSMVAEDDETSKDREIDKLMALISLSFKKIYKPTNNNLQTSSNTSRANQDNSPNINRNARYENQRIGNVAEARETVGSSVEEDGIQLNVEQADWKDDTDDDELEDQELEAHYMYMAQLQEVSPNAADSGPIFDDEPLQKNDDDNDLAKDRELLASLIKKLKCEIDESKNRNKFLKTSNKVLIEKLKGEIEDFKNKNKSLESSNNFFKEANNKLSETNNLLYADYKKLKAELARRKSTEYASQMELECAKVRERSRLSHINVNNGKSKESFNKQTTLLEKRIDESILLDKQCQSSLENFKVKSYVNTIISGVELCKQKSANRTYIGYIDPFIQSTIESNFCPVISRISAGLNQFHRCLNEEMVDDLRYFNSLESEVDSLKSQLKSQKTQFLNEIDRLSKEYYYADHMNAILGVYTELDEYFEIQDLKAQLQDKGIVISELKKLIEKLKGKSVDTKFEKSSVIQQPNAFKSQRPSVLGKPTTFSNSFVRKDFSKSTESTRFIRDLKGNDILTGSCGTDLYSIILKDTNCPNPICLMAKATSSQAWLWHRRLSHLNFDTINLLSKNDIVVGLPKLKFVKDHLYSSCVLGKAKRKSFHTKLTPSSKRRLHLLHMDLCGPMRVASINGKRYVLVIIDDYSRYTWTYFLRSKDETPEVLISFLRLVQRGLQAQVRVVRTDKGTKILNQTLHAYFAAEGILHQTSDPAPKCQSMALNHDSLSPAIQFPTLVPTISSSENINQAETYAENDQVADDEFINI